MEFCVPLNKTYLRDLRGVIKKYETIPRYLSADEVLLKKKKLQRQLTADEK